MINISLQNGLKYSVDNNVFELCSISEGIKYLKGIYTNKERFLERYYKPQYLYNNEYLNILLDDLLNKYDDAKPYTYAEAFVIKNEAYKSLVFGSIDINEMINNLGHTRINTAGKQVKHKQFDNSGNFIGYKEYDNVYETHAINSNKLGLTEELYAVKCWCTSTNKEHWIWIEDKYKNDPLEAIASTFRIHENLVPHIKELKRQGDILLVELNNDIEPEGNIISLNSEQYFSLLTAQS